tara:strand:+ start:4451 stop:4642 length:192 start_codon:yes stop_codon:yes gene_type:complete
MGVFSEKRESRKIADIKKRIDSLSERVSDMEEKMSLVIKKSSSSNLGVSIPGSSSSRPGIKSL